MYIGISSKHLEKPQQIQVAEVPQEIECSMKKIDTMVNNTIDPQEHVIGDELAILTAPEYIGEFLKLQSKLLLL